MARATVTRRESEPYRGPDLLEGVKYLDLKHLTPNQVRALLILCDHVIQNSQSDNTLAGEVEHVESEIYRALGAKYGKFDAKVERYLDRDDIAEGTVRFLKGGAHV